MKASVATTMDVPALAVLPWSTSTFGWVGPDYTADGNIVAGRPLKSAATWGFPNEARRLEVVPMFTIGCQGAGEALLVEQAEKRQSIREARVLGEACADLRSFHATMGRYAVLVFPHCGGALAGVLADDERFLLRLAILLLRYQPSLLYLLRDGALAVVFDRVLFLGRYRFPRTDAGLVADLDRFSRAVGSVGSYRVGAPRSAPQQEAPISSSHQPLGWWDGPLAHPSPDQREFVRVALQSYPTFLPITGDPPQGPARPGLWTCLANDWYDHRAVLREYVGLDADIQIHGKIQHGWQSGCGIDGERGYKPEAGKQQFPVFLWNRRNLDAARAEGIDWPGVRAIGAPFLYREAGLDPGPVGKALLCFPYHSVPEYPISADWSRYGEGLLVHARELGFSDVTVCLHHHDVETDGPREALRALGIEVVTAGHALEPHFLDRLEFMIREHAAVTSDRICTAGLYAEALGRPFFVSGAELVSDPPDPDVGLGADREWIAHEMPEFLTFTGAAHRETALRELGAEFRQDRESLRHALYGWYL